MVDLIILALPDHVPDGLVHPQDLKGRDHPAPRPGEQLLADHALQNRRQLLPGLALLDRREGVDDPVDGADGPLSVEGRDDEMPRLRRCQGGLHGLVVPHLAEENDIRRLAQTGPQGREAVRRVDGDLPLANEALIVPVEVLDGVLQRHDVGRAAVVDPVDEAGLGGGFAAAGGAGDQHHPAPELRQVHDPLRDAQLLPIRHPEGHHPHHGGQGPPLAVGVHPEPGQIRPGEGEVVVPRLPVVVHGPARQGVELGDEGFRVGGRGLLRLHGADAALQLVADGSPRHQKEVGGSVIHRPAKIFQQAHLKNLLPRPRGSGGRPPASLPLALPARRGRYMSPPPAGR